MQVEIFKTALYLLRFLLDEPHHYGSGMFRPRLAFAGTLPRPKAS
jgi:hypothetical protein